MRSRTLLVTIAVGVILLLGVAVGGLYQILAASPLQLLDGGVETAPQAAVFVSRRAPVMVSLLTNPERINGLAALNTPLSQRRRSQAELIDFEQRLLVATNLDYRTDIKPWLGDEVTYAITSTDFDRNPDNGWQPGYLLVAQARYPQRAKNFLQKAYSKQALAADRELVYQQYQGVNLIYQQPTNLDQAVPTTAIVGNFVLFANHPKVLKAAINNVQAVNLNLQQADYYSEAIAAIDEPRIAIAYANLPAVSSLLTQQPQIEVEGQTLTVAFRLKPEGLVAQTALTTSADLPNTTAKFTEPIETLAYLPAQSILAIAGDNLQQLWTKINTYLADNTPLAVIANQTIAGVQARLGLDLGENIFSWVQGKYGLALFPNADNDGLDWLFLTETNPAATEGIAALDQLAQTQKLSVGDFEIADSSGGAVGKTRTVTAWTRLVTATDQENIDLKAQVSGVHTEIDGYQVLASSIDAITATESDNFSIEESESDINPTLAKAIDILPLPNDGYVYFNWRGGKPWFRQQLSLIRVVELLAEPLFDRLEALTIASQGTTEGVEKAAVFLDLY